MSSGTDACVNACLALRDFGAKDNDEVICPALTFVATVNAVLTARLTPVFVDISRNTLNIDPSKIEDAITPKTRAIMVTHTMGKPCEMDTIMEIANRKGLYVLEDCCLTPGQNIVTSSGLKKIEDVKIEDKVYTHTGKFHKVINTMNKEYQGAICDIYTYGQSSHLYVTEEHPLLTAKTSNVLMSRSTDWVPAKDVRVGDYLVLPRYTNVEDIDEYDFSKYEYISSNSKYKVLFESRFKQNVPVNNHLMSMIGWYLAEGWCYRQHVEFALSVEEDENENIEELVQSIEQLGFDYEIQHRDPDSKCLYMCVFSKQLKQFLGDNFGNGAANKLIPNWVLDLPSNKLLFLLHSYVKGNGCKVKDRKTQYSVTSISLHLLENIRLICSKLGYYAGITKTAFAGKRRICGRTVKVSDKYQLRFSTARLNKLDRRTYMDDQYIYYRVRSVEHKTYTGPVFNIEVEEDNSYCVLGWAVHNCEAHGAKYKDKFIGKWGHVSMFSYYAAHIVVAGEGGMCSTDYDDYAEVVKSTKSHGRKPGTNYFDFIRIGLNSKMNDLEAAIGLEGVSQFWDTIHKRNRNKNILFGLIDDLSDHIRFWRDEEYEVISPHAFPILLKEEGRCESLYRFLEENSIQCKTLFGSMPTQHQAFEFLNYKPGDFPEAEYVGSNGLHFGIHQYLTEDDINYVAEKLKIFFGEM